MTNKFEEVTFRTDHIYSGKIISLQIEHVTLPNGEIAAREVVKHPGAVAVIALHENKLIVVEQYRKALGRNQVEIPAGKLEAGEQPMEAAKRELKEETGYDCADLRHVCSFFTSPGFADEMIHLFMAENLIQGQKKLDDDEFLDCESITLEQAQEYMRLGRISDAKTITAIYAWQLYTLTGKL